MSAAEKKEFVIKQVFTDVIDNGIHKEYFGKPENRCNLQWTIQLVRYSDGSSIIYLACSKLRGADIWSIEAETNLQLDSEEEHNFSNISKHYYGNYSTNSSDFIFSKAGIDDYIVDGNLTVEVHVKITKMKGIKLENLRNFDESAKEFSDVVLKVNDEKFYVLKTYLAAHSSYFKSLFFGNFDESNKSEIELKDVDPQDFQNFLEVLYADPAIDENTVKGILHLGHVYDAKSVIRQCEKFLTEHSNQPLKMKFEMATKYKLDKLTKKCISEMKTKEDVLSVLPGDCHVNKYGINKYGDQQVWEELLRKLASLM